jgi:hypothetical protein
MAQVDLKQTAVGSIVTPASGYNSLFVDANGQLWTLNSSGGQQVPSDGIAVITATSAAINTTHTQIIGATLRAGTLVAGSTIRIKASGTCTSSAANISNFRLRIGTTTLTGNIVVSVDPTGFTSGTNIPFTVEVMGTVRTVGSSGTALGAGWLNNNGTTGVSNAAIVAAQTTATVTVNTTVDNIVELTYVAAATTTTCTFYNATIEVVK